MTQAKASVFFMLLSRVNEVISVHGIIRWRLFNCRRNPSRFSWRSRADSALTNTADRARQRAIWGPLLPFRFLKLSRKEP